MTSELAGRSAPPSLLADIDELLATYHERTPDPTVAAERVSFGTSGHRGSSLSGSFNQAHIVAMTAAIVRHRGAAGISGPLFIGRDTHALSEPAFRTAVEVLAAAGVDVRIDARDGYTPTPGISHAILRWNREHDDAIADGIVVTPSHNPPEDGGFKYDPPTGGPADAATTKAIEADANRLLAEGVDGIARTPWERAAASVARTDYLDAYVGDLDRVIDMTTIAASGVRLGVDPMGGAAVAWWGAIADRYGLALTVTNDTVDPTFGFMSVDWDGRIRMDPSSRHAMAGLIARRADFDLALGNDADADRFGVVTPAAGLLAPNHVLAVAVDDLFGDGRDWPDSAAIGKTLVSSAIIDRVAEARGRRLLEVPVGFKWFVDGLLDGSVGFGGEESAGCSFLDRAGKTWTTDKDGIIACLLAAEITARTGRDPGEHYAGLTERFGAPSYRRIDSKATPDDKARLSALRPEDVTATTLAGDPIVRILTHAPGNDAPIGGLKVESVHGWFAARPSGTEAVTKLYAESFVDEAHLETILAEAPAIIGTGGGTDA